MQINLYFLTDSAQRTYLDVGLQVVGASTRYAFGNRQMCAKKIVIEDAVHSILLCDGQFNDCGQPKW